MTGKTVRTKTRDKVLIDAVRVTPVDQYAKRSRIAVLLVLIAVPLVVVVIGYTGFNQVNRIDVPVSYANDTDHFKYGSIGSDALGRGLPYWILQALPVVFPDLLPGGFAGIGAVTEPGMDLPIGFSKRRTGFIDSVNVNCAICHTATVRETPVSEPMVFLAASSHQLNLWSFFDFLFKCVADSRYTTENMMAAIDGLTDLSPIERFAYKRAITEFRTATLQKAGQIEWANTRPPWGPGRVDTFNPYKTLVFGLDMSHDTTIGTADFMTIWNQQARDGLFVHWDGNNPSVDERNLSAALGAGASPDTLDLPRIERIKNWIWTLEPPPYPFAIDVSKLEMGRKLYDVYCAECHDPAGEYYGQVVPVSRLGTDPERANAFDMAMAERMNTIGKGHEWQFRHFRATDGYANHPLDGVWLRAPFLHNGSVPTMWDLLNPAAKRPTQFYRGNDVYDQVRMGFESREPAEGGKRFFEYDTTLRGNDNGGHEYGTELNETQKAALIEYLKTL